MIKAGIIGATGYAGAELVRLLAGHPEVNLVALTTQSYGGVPFGEVYPHLDRYVSMVGEELNLTALAERADVIFTALPHGHAVPVAAEAAGYGKKLIDLGADFRLQDPATYEAWYKVVHQRHDLLDGAVYGLPELYRGAIRGAMLVANPGCYPTSAILGLAPLLKKGLLDTGSIIIDSKSGVSGAGRGLSLATHYGEVNENIRAYNVAIHRHTPEIEQELGRLAGGQLTVSFTPHLTPMTRGILSTMYGNLKQSLTGQEVLKLYHDFYAGENFIHILPGGKLPSTKNVWGTNRCAIAPVVDPRTGRVVVVAAIDNLIKGAAGQAVQNMNLMFGLPENMALEQPGMYP